VLPEENCIFMLVPKSMFFWG